MIKRIVTSVIFIPILIFVIHLDYFYSLPLFLFILSISIFSSRELYEIFKRIFKTKNSNSLIIFFIISNALLYILYYVDIIFRIHFLNLSIINIIVMILILLESSVPIDSIKVYKRAVIILFSYILTGVCPFFIYLLKLENGEWWVYFLFILAWISDASAYFVGYYFGKTKGIIRYSPNKSLEGYIGSFVFTLMVSVCFKLIFPLSFTLSLFKTLLLGIIISILAPSGDILESILKRRADIKDSSGMFKAFGGVLDIFDSIIFSSPFYYLFIKLIL